MRYRRNPTLTRDDIQRDVNNVFKEKPVSRGDCTLQYVYGAEDEFLLRDNESGHQHRLAVKHTDKKRLGAHWEGFLAGCGWHIDTAPSARRGSKFSASSALLSDLRTRTMDNDHTGAFVILAREMLYAAPEPIHGLSPVLHDLENLEAKRDRRGYITQTEAEEFRKLAQKVLKEAEKHYTAASYKSIRGVL